MRPLTWPCFLPVWSRPVLIAHSPCQHLHSNEDRLRLMPARLYRTRINAQRCSSTAISASVFGDSVFAFRVLCLVCVSGLKSRLGMGWGGGSGHHGLLVLDRLDRLLERALMRHLLVLPRASALKRRFKLVPTICGPVFSNDAHTPLMPMPACMMEKKQPAAGALR